MFSLAPHAEPHVPETPRACDSPCELFVRNAAQLHELTRTAEREIAQSIGTVRVLFVAAAVLPSLIAWFAAGLLALGCGWLATTLVALAANGAALVVVCRPFLRWIRCEAFARTLASARMVTPDLDTSRIDRGQSAPPSTARGSGSPNGRRP